MHANEVPDFAAPSPKPDDCFRSEDLPTGDKANLCNQAFIAGVTLLMPKLYATWQLDEDVVRFFEYCHRTYRDGAGILRQVLIDLANRWKELALAGSCPYPLPTSEELLAHHEEYKAPEHAQALRKFVTSSLNTASDGWVPTEVWKETTENHKKLYDKLLQDMDEEDLRQVWPFDEPGSMLEDRGEDVREADSRLPSTPC
ncbi:MAG: hypothetical protein L6R40_006514 [Gallowayella cf. fulva]|nr:MAG: hypothetical protein L6R40_006514 [Xanthomendoza cf. fulva]